MAEGFDASHMSSTPAPVEVGDEYVVEIEEIGERGDPIAHVDDFAVMVPDGELGERAAIRIEDVAENFAEATIVEEESNVK